MQPRARAQAPPRGPAPVRLRDESAAPSECPRSGDMRQRRSRPPRRFPRRSVAALARCEARPRCPARCRPLPRRALRAPRPEPHVRPRSAASSSRWSRAAWSGARDRRSPGGDAAAPLRRMHRACRVDGRAGETALLELAGHRDSRSTSAATSSFGAVRPQAYARLRPSANTRRAATSSGSSSGRSSASEPNPCSSRSPSGRSSSASTYASPAGGPTNAIVALGAEQQPDRLGRGSSFPRPSRRSRRSGRCRARCRPRGSERDSRCGAV